MNTNHVKSVELYAVTMFGNSLATITCSRRSDLTHTGTKTWLSLLTILDEVLRDRFYIEASIKITDFDLTVFFSITSTVADFVAAENLAKYMLNEIGTVVDEVVSLFSTGFRASNHSVKEAA